MTKAILSAMTDGDNVKWLLKQGIGWSLLTLVLWWIVPPMRDAHLQLVRDVAATNAKNAVTLEKQTTILQWIENRLEK